MMVFSMLPVQLKWRSTKGAHDENPAQGDVDSRNAQQTPPHGHDSEQGILNRSKNICFLYLV
jgi:hypothetical protein